MRSGKTWRTRFRPAALQGRPRAGCPQWPLSADTARLVAQIDQLVALVEEGLETKLQALRLAQGVSLALLLSRREPVR
jgi:nitrate/nitrite-specific signal transduction histidine kinase